MRKTYNVWLCTLHKSSYILNGGFLWDRGLLKYFSLPEANACFKISYISFLKLLSSCDVGEEIANEYI